MHKLLTLPRPAWRLSPAYLTAIYVLVGMLWIPASDYFLAVWISEMESLTRIQTAKGGFFVLTTAAMLYLLIQRAMAALQKGHAQLHAIIEGTTDAVFIKDAQGRYALINTVCSQIFKKSTEEMIGKDDTQLLSPETASRIREEDRQVMRSGNTQMFEGIVTVAGVTRAYSTVKAPYRDKEGRIMGVIGIARDITERKRSEETIKTLLCISEKLNAILDTDRLLEVLVQEAIGLTHAQGGCSGLRTPKGMVCHKYFKNTHALPLEYCWPPGHGLAGWVLVHKASYLTNDALYDPQIAHDWCVRMGIRSVLNTPILDAHGEVIGFFEIHNKKDACGFTPADQELLMALSHSAAIAIQNALAYEEIKRAEMALCRAHEELERRVQERTVELRQANRRLEQEIAERRQAEAALRESEERFRQIAEHIREVIWITDAVTRQNLYVNRAYEAIWGRPPNNPYEQYYRWLESIHAEDRQRVEEAYLQTPVSGEFDQEYRIVRPDGSIRWVRDRAFAVRNAAGEVYRYAGIIEDITERKRVDEKLRQQQAELAHMGRFAIAGEMASGLAHELNQPLAAIKTYIHACLLLLQSKQINSEQLAEVMEKVAAQAQRAGEIIQRLRNLVRKAEPCRSAANINELIQEVACLIEPQARQQEVRLHVELADALPLVWVDTIQIQQVVLNLVHNAIEVLSEIQAGRREVTIRTALSEGDSIEVTVADSGPGVSAEAMGRLFMPFFTTKPTGMGLGLSISQSIIEVHGGRLWAMSSPDQGAVFRFTLPTVLHL